MIWARPLSFDGGLDASLLGRAGLGAPERASLESERERLTLITGLGDGARARLAAVSGIRLLGGAQDAAILPVSRASLGRWRQGGLEGPVGDALERLFAADVPPEPLELGPRRFEWGQRTFVMGVVNVTPDSFSDGGRYLAVDTALAHAEALAEAGADLLDVGGESTRPGAAEVGEAEELARVVPVIEAIARRLPRLPLSIDTSKPVVARRAVEAGAHLINDVEGLRSQAMAAVVGELGVPVCVMHMLGSPRTMQVEPSYDDLVAEVLDALEAAVRRAEAHGVKRSRVLVDPGIGFGKTLEHNLVLLRHLGSLRLLGAPVLVGTSRKSFLGALTSGQSPGERDAATAGSAAAVAMGRGADLVRVHDVAGVRDAVRVADAIARASGGGRKYVG